MKNFVVGFFTLIIVSFIFLSFKNKSTKKPPSTVDVTLNGVDEVTARQMINNFANNYDLDTGPKSVCAFYTVEQIRAIDNVLQIEKADATIKLTGVRFYLGSDQPLGHNTKLKIKIFLVSTQEREEISSNHTSLNGDYYTHQAGVLSTQEIGVATDDSGSLVMSQGGTLYSPATSEPTFTPCINKPSVHFLPGDSAYRWVQARYENGEKGSDALAYNTKSEWFDYCFLNAFFTVIINSGKYSGMRIYLGKGLKDANGVIRDVFILVPTVKSQDGTKDLDDYNCLEDVNPAAFSCEREKQEFLKRKLHGNLIGAGYDDGELCPDVCN